MYAKDKLLITLSILIMVLTMTSLSITVSAATLYVNISEPGCSNSSTYVQAQNPLTPWCNLTQPISQGKMLSGDTVYVAAGTYNDNLAWQNTVITSNITISAWPGDTVIIESYPNSIPVWQNKSTSTYGLWTANISTTSCTNCTSLTSGRFYKSNSTLLFNWGALSETGFAQFKANSYSYGIPFAACRNNSAAATTWVFSTDRSWNPNNDRIYMSRLRALSFSGMTVQSGANIIIQGFTFNRSMYGIYLHDTSNVVIRNNKFYGHYSAIDIDGSDGFYSNITIYNNTFDQYASYWDHNITNQVTPMKTEMIDIADFSDKIEIYNNILNNTMSGIRLSTDNTTELADTRVYNNTFWNGHQSQLEIEKYCYNTSYHDNKMFHVHIGPSFAPANASHSPEPCTFYNNIIYANNPGLYGGSDDKPYAIKDNNISNMAISNWYIHHNTIATTGRAIRNTRMPDGPNAWVNTTIINNIIVSGNSFGIDGTSDPQYGVIWDYNLHYSNTSLGGRFARGYGKDTTASNYTFTTLALAKAAGVVGTSAWNVNSQEAWPLFQSVSLYNFTPATNSPACNMSTTGDYVGALNCTPPDLPEVVESDEITINITVTDPSGTELSNGYTKIDGTQCMGNPCIVNLTLGQTYTFEFGDADGMYLTQTDTFAFDGLDITRALEPVGILLNTTDVGLWAIEYQQLDSEQNRTYYLTTGFNISPSEYPEGTLSFELNPDGPYTQYYQFINNQSLYIQDTVYPMNTSCVWYYGISAFTAWLFNLSNITKCFDFDVAITIKTPSDKNIAGATVRVERNNENNGTSEMFSLVSQKVTDQDGYAEFPLSSNWSYRIRATAPGYASSTWITIDKQRNTSNFHQSAVPGSSLTGTITLKPLISDNLPWKCYITIVGGPKIIQWDNNISITTDTAAADYIHYEFRGINHRKNFTGIGNPSSITFNPTDAQYATYVENESFNVSIHQISGNISQLCTTVHFERLGSWVNRTSAINISPSDAAYNYIPLFLFVLVLLISGAVSYVTVEGYGSEAWTLGMIICSIWYPYFALAAIPIVLNMLFRIIKPVVT